MSYAALIFSHSITPRLQYIVDFLSRYYGFPFRLTSNEETYLNGSDACKINYSYHRLSAGEIFIHPHALLSESYIRQVKTECFEVHGHPAFFKAEGDTGFDLFAAIFFLLTRYEEYLEFHKDAYGRYAHENSVAFRNNFLQLPLVDIWLEEFRNTLAARNPDFKKQHQQFSFLPTYDIDMAWTYRNKGFKRNTGAIMLSIIKGRFRTVAQRIKVLRGKAPDPYDAYEWMDQLHNRFDLDPVYFFLVAHEKSRHDKNISTAHPEFKRLVHDIASRYTIGLHPSWASGNLPYLLTKEKHTLEQMAGKPVQASRQHFIRFQLPLTYQRLLSLGIVKDFSMGYGSINGFRASVAHPYYWYDLKHEESTKLLLYPFCFMDANAYYEQKQTPEAALKELMQFYDVTRLVGGTLTTIWHNSFLGSASEFPGWREMYEQFIERTHVNVHKASA